MYKVLLIAVIFSFNASAKVVSVKSGKWGSAATWSTGQVPNSTDTVEVTKGHEIALSQVLNQCKYLMNQGSVYCASSGRSLQCGTILLNDSGSLSSSVLGTVETDSLICIGKNTLAGFNLKIKEKLEVKGDIVFERTSGKIEINELLIYKGASWSSTGGQSFSIAGNFENNGKFDAGSGAYSFVGNNTFRGAENTIINRFYFTDVVINSGRLQINISMEAPDSATFVNESSGTLLLKTTNANLRVKQFDFSQSSNSLIMARGTTQKLPTAIANEYQNITVSKAGELTVDANIKLNGLLTLDTSSILSVNKEVIVAANSSLIINKGAELEFNHTAQNSFTKLCSSFNKIKIDPTSSVVVNSEIDFSLPVLPYGNLVLNSNALVEVLSLGDQVFKGDLKLGKGVKFNINNRRINIFGNGEGTGEFTMITGLVRYAGGSKQKILPCDYDTLVIDNLSQDTCVASGTYHVNTLKVDQGKVKIGSLQVGEFIVEKGGEAVVGSVSLTIGSALINKGLFTITSNSSTCTFHGMLMNSGVFSNNSSSDHLLFADILNKGTFIGCNGTGCTWQVPNNLELTGDSTVHIPRLLFTQSDTLFNNGHLDVSTSIRGKGRIVNLSNSSLALGMNSDQNESSINAWEFAGNSMLFNKANDQSISHVEFNKFQNLSISGKGAKNLLSDINVAGDLTIDTSATFDFGAYQVIVDTSSKLSMKEKSTLIVGNSLSLSPTVFPVDFQSKNLSIHQNATISYESAGDQIISTVPDYGNLSIKDGAVAQSGKLVGPGDSLNVNGNLIIHESSVMLTAQNKVIDVKGDWKGPGTMELTKCKLLFHGNADASGGLILNSTPVHYVGLGTQELKNTTYSELIINKQAGVGLVNAGPGKFVVESNMDIKDGKVRVGGEHFEIMGRLVLNDTMFFKSRVQDKILKDVWVKEKGYLDNTHGIDIHVQADFRLDGKWVNGKGSTIFFNGQSDQKLTGGEAVFDKIILTSSLEGKDMEVKGVIDINDSLILENTSLKLDSALITLALGAKLYGESQQNSITGINNSEMKAITFLDSAVHENIAGFGYSVYAKEAFGNVALVRGFESVNLPTGEKSVRKSFLLETDGEEEYIYQTSFQYYPYELTDHNESLLTVYYDDDYTDIYRIGFSTLHSQFDKIAFSRLKTGTKVTFGEQDSNPLSVVLKSFSAEYHNDYSDSVRIDWQVSTEINTAKYLLYLSEDGVNFSYLSEINWKKGDYEGNSYSYTYQSSSSGTQLYFKLFEQDLFGKETYLDIDSAQREITVSVVEVNGQTVLFSGNVKYQRFAIFDLKGRQLNYSTGSNILTTSLGHDQVCILCAFSPQVKSCKKVFLK